MSLIIPANTLASGGYAVDNSLRFNSGSSDYLSRTPSSAGNVKTITYSIWLKRSVLGSGDFIHIKPSGSDYPAFSMHFTNDLIRFYDYNGSAFIFNFITTQLFRDVSAWYHIVLAIDTTQGTEANRVKFYVNGSQVTSFGTSSYPSQNASFSALNTDKVNYISGYASGGYYNGYMAEVCFIDGQQLDPTSFGEFDEDSGIWKPIDVSGLTFGTNGFYLEFKQAGTGTNSSGMGADTSGNDNHFAVNNLTAIDQTTDTPTNNFATWNVLSAYNSTTAGTLSEGNLKSSGAGSDGGIPSTIGVSSGKWYWEVKFTDEAGGDPVIGIINSAGQSKMQNANIGSATSGSGVWCLFNLTSGGVGIQENGVFSAYPPTTLADGDILNIALDVDAQKLWYGKNGTWHSSGNPATGANATSTNLTANETWFAYVEKRNSSSISEINFGSPPFAISSGNTDGNDRGNFEYAVPSGYLSLCTKNLSEVLG